MIAKKPALFSVDVRELAERLTSLTLAQAAELCVCLEDVHGIRPAASSITVKDETKVTPPPEPTHFSVILTGLADPGKKINVFKTVREITNLGLKETRELVEGAPSLIQAKLLKDEAMAVQKKLESAGARITMVPAQAE